MITDDLIPEGFVKVTVEKWSGTEKWLVETSADGELSLAPLKEKLFKDDTRDAVYVIYRD